MGYEQDKDVYEKPAEYKEEEIAGFTKRLNWFEDETTCNDWVRAVMQRVRWRMFEQQSDMLWLTGELERSTDEETGEYRSSRPCFYPDADDAIYRWVEEELSDLAAGITYQLILDYAWYGNIDLPDSLLAELDRYGCDVAGLREAHGVRDAELPEVVRGDWHNCVIDNGRSIHPVRKPEAGKGGEPESADGGNGGAGDDDADGGSPEDPCGGVLAAKVD